ncbi:MAG: cyclic nucleotide-binding domain-containing protein, partial [Anaerolineales bacterium]
VRACERVYGRPLAEQMMGEFNRVAALDEWGLYFRANGRLSEEASGDLLSLANIFQSALADLLGRMAHYTGADFVENSLIQAYDALPWQLREVAGPNLLSFLPWARRLKIGQTASVIELLRATPVFSSLPAESLGRLAQLGKTEHHSAKSRLHASSQALRWARLIRSGRVELIAHEGGTRRTVNMLDRGAVIGLTEILHTRPAEAEARTVTAVELLRLPAEAVREALRDAPARPEAALLGRIPLFRELSSEQLRRLAEALHPQTLLPHEVVVQYGETGRELYLIGQGELIVSVPGANGGERVVSHLGPGEFFGEIALLRDKPRSATVRALTNARVWSLSAADYAAFLRETPALQAALEQLGSRLRLELRTA